jgi:hypothetical protein
MWWQRRKPSCSNASLSENVPVRPCPEPITFNATLLPALIRNTNRFFHGSSEPVREEHRVMTKPVLTFNLPGAPASAWISSSH